jgi:5'(3')-deoxyribonucleotidase
MKKSSIPKRICVDMDEVIADTVAEHLVRYNRDHHESLTKIDLLGKWIWEAVPEHHHRRLDEYLRSEDFFEVLDVMADSQRVLHALQAHYEVFIATAAMEVPTSFNAKYRWLGRHFPFIPTAHIVFCGDKSILRADYLIDDNPRQLKRFVGEGILYDAPHNQGAGGFQRVKNWLEVEELFLKELRTQA